MEYDIHEHVAKHDLLFLDDSKASEAKPAEFEHLYPTLNVPESPIRNRLRRLTADSPELLGVIKTEGRV